MLSRYTGQHARSSGQKARGREGGGVETAAGEADAVAKLRDEERAGADDAVRRCLARDPLPTRVRKEGQRDRVASHAVHGAQDAGGLHQRLPTPPHTITASARCSMPC
eukprot:795149-Rhodomonas_salina.1